MRATVVGAILLAGAPLLAGGAAEAGCTRQIVNRSGLIALVRRDGGPYVAIPPHRAQSIRLDEPGRIEVALVCGPPGTAAGVPERAIYRDSFAFEAVIDRCYYTFGDHLPFHDQLGPGFFGTQDTKPLTVNVPRQGDATIGPFVEERCPVELRESLRALY